MTNAPMRSDEIFENPRQMLDRVKLEHSECRELFEVEEGWAIWLQDGPSEDIMLVNEKLNVVIRYGCEIFGPSRWDMPITSLARCGWIKFWDLDEED